MTEPTTSELGEIKQIVSDSLHQIRTRALRDAPVYLQHVSSAESQLIQAIEQKYILKSKVIEAIGADEKEEFISDYYDKGREANQLRKSIRQTLNLVEENINEKA